MTWLAIKLFLGGALKRLAGVFGWLTANTQRMLIALLALSLVGNIWLWRGWSSEQDDHADTKASWRAAERAWKDASDANAAAAIAQVKAVEAKSAQLAKEADYEHRIALNDARSRVNAYARRMRIEGGVCRSDPSPAAEGENPGIPADLPADTGMVAISRTDLQDLADWLAFGVKAHNNAVDKIEAGLAEPLTEADIPKVNF